MDKEDIQEEKSQITWAGILILTGAVMVIGIIIIILFRFMVSNG